MFIAQNATPTTISVKDLEQGVREKLARFRLANDDDAVTSITTDTYLFVQTFDGRGNFISFVLKALQWKVMDFIKNRKFRSKLHGNLPEECDPEDNRKPIPEDYIFSEIEDKLNASETKIVQFLLAGATIEQIKSELGYTGRSWDTTIYNLKKKLAA